MKEKVMQQIKDGEKRVDEINKEKEKEMQIKKEYDDSKNIYRANIQLKMKDYELERKKDLTIKIRTNE